MVLRNRGKQFLGLAASLSGPQEGEKPPRFDPGGDFFPDSARGSLTVIWGSGQCSHGNITVNIMGVHGCCKHLKIGLLFLTVEL